MDPHRSPFRRMLVAEINLPGWQPVPEVHGVFHFG